LLLWPAASTDKKGSKLDIGNLATRGKIRLMPDEHPVGITIDGEQPSITVGAVVNLSRTYLKIASRSRSAITVG